MIEETGRTREEAVARAVATLGISHAEAAVTVLEERRHRFLGLFGGPVVRVRVERRGARRAAGRRGDGGGRATERDAADLAGDAERVRGVVEGILGSMGISARVRVENGRGGAPHVNVETAASDGLLIGRRGQTLLALEHVANRILTRARDDRPIVEVDVGGYRQRNGDPVEEEPERPARRVGWGRRRSRGRAGANA